MIPLWMSISHGVGWGIAFVAVFLYVALRCHLPWERSVSKSHGRFDEHHRIRNRADLFEAECPDTFHAMRGICSDESIKDVLENWRIDRKKG